LFAKNVIRLEGVGEITKEMHQYGGCRLQSAKKNLIFHKYHKKKLTVLK